MTTVLVVGATGELGRLVVPLLRDAGLRVRVLVRPGRANELTQSFASLGVEVAGGDLKDPPSLAAACRGVGTVVSTATSTTTRLDGDSIETVDRAGTLALIEAAEASGVDHFVYLSFVDIEPEFPLLKAKREVQARLQSSGTMAYTVLKPTYFMETWLAMLFTKKVDPATGKEAFNVFGTGKNPVSWISRADVAKHVVRAVTEPEARGIVEKLGGPEAVSQLAALELFASGSSPMPLMFSTETELGGGVRGAPDSLMRSFCGLMLGVAQGMSVPPTRVPSLAIASPLRTVKAFVQEFTMSRTRA